jgi:polygalacturonase
LRRSFLAAIVALLAVHGFSADNPAPTATKANEPSTITPNKFKGSDTERINRAIEAAAAAGGQVVIPRVNIRDTERSEVWLLDSAILLRSNVTLVLDDCRLKLSDRCRDNFMRSANCGLGITDIQPLRNIHIRGIGHPVLEGADRPRATGDGAKVLGKDTYGTDAGVAGENPEGDWRNIGMLLAFVEEFSIENLAVHDSHCWAISLERCANGKVRDIEFASNPSRVIDGAKRTILNQDGLDLRMGCHDIAIENISGYTGDDLIALTAVPGERTPGGLESTMVSGTIDRGHGLEDIHHVTLRNIKGFSRGGCHIVRLLNTRGVKMHDITVEDVTDTSPAGRSCRAALKIGDRRERWGGPPPLGDTSRITARNINSRAQFAILIAGSLSDSSITDVVDHGPAPESVTLESGAKNIRDVTITNVRKVSGEEG